MASVCFHNGIVLNGTYKFENGGVLVKECVIVDVFNEARFAHKRFPPDTYFIDVRGAYIAPGFIDTHIHGTGGFGTDTVSDQNNDIIGMANALAAMGVTSFCPTLYPKPKDIMLTILADTVKDMAVQNGLIPQERGARILGVHMEGPFISKERLGVHKPECALVPDIDVMNEFIAVGENHIVNMTVAPELKNMHELALLASNNGIVLQAGHTNAEYKHIIEGIQVGIQHSTHFFNAMTRLHHRNPGTVGAILLQPEMSCEIIADGFHVHPLLVSLLLNNKQIDKVVLVTDALTPTAFQGEVLMANGDALYLKDNVFYTRDADIMAGSSLTMQQGVKNLVSWGISVEHAVRMATSNPADILNIQNKGKLIPKYDADIIVFDEDIHISHVMIEGTLLPLQ